MTRGRFGAVCQSDESRLRGPVLAAECDATLSALLLKWT
jgi:hypothetical protein